MYPNIHTHNIGESSNGAENEPNIFRAILKFTFEEVWSVFIECWWA